jgi:hypothetical protein
MGQSINVVILYEANKTNLVFFLFQNFNEDRRGYNHQGHEGCQVHDGFLHHDGDECRLLRESPPQTHGAEALGEPQQIRKADVGCWNVSEQRRDVIPVLGYETENRWELRGESTP